MEENTMPVIGGFYRHFKNRLYQVLHLAVDANTEEALVVYQALYGDFRVYVRPLREFISEVDHEKYPDVKQKFRFVKVTLRLAAPISEPVEKSAAEPVGEPSGKAEREAFREPEEARTVHPLLLKFLDADTYEQRLGIFDEMEGIADMHMLNAVAASLDIALGDCTMEEAFSLIRDNLATQKKYECSRWR